MEHALETWGDREGEDSDLPYRAWRVVREVSRVHVEEEGTKPVKVEGQVWSRRAFQAEDTACAKLRGRKHMSGPGNYKQFSVIRA